MWKSGISAIFQGAAIDPNVIYGSLGAPAFNNGVTTWGKSRILVVSNNFPQIIFLGALEPLHIDFHQN